MSWVDSNIKKFHNIEQKLAKKFGIKIAKKIIKIYSFPYRVSKRIKQDGFIGTIKFAITKLFKPVKK